MINGRKQDLCEDMTTPLLRSAVVPFEIHKHCVICGKGVNMNPLFLHHSTNPASFREGLKNAAEKRSDCTMVLHRLSGITDGQKISYHRSCHKQITSSRNNTVTNKTNDSLKTHDTLDLLLTELQQQLFEEKQVLVLSEVCTRYEILNRQKNAMATGEEKIRSFWLKAKLEKAFGERVIFFIQRGSPCAFCSRDVPIGLLLKDTKSNNPDTVAELDMLEGDLDRISDLECLHKAAGVLRQE